MEFKNKHRRSAVEVLAGYLVISLAEVKRVAGYRFSKDLDFTVNLKSQLNIKAALANVCQEVALQSGIELSLIDFELKRDLPYEEAFQGKVSFVGPRRQRGNPLRLKLDLTKYEKVVLKPQHRPLIHIFSDQCSAQLMVYPIEEILGEKLRTLIQRAYARDYYDIWAIIQLDKDLNYKKIKRIYDAKCEFKQVDVDIVSFLVENISKIQNYYEPSLAPQIKDLPDFEEVNKGVSGFIEKVMDS